LRLYSISIYIVSLYILSLYRLKYENPVYIEVPGNRVIAACGIFFAIFARDSIIEVIMDVLNTIIQILLMVCNLICFIMVLKELWTENMVFGILCLVGTCISGIGGLVLFIWGWFQQELRPIMVFWSIGQVCLIVMILLFGKLW